MESPVPMPDGLAPPAPARGQPGAPATADSRCSGSWFPARDRAVGSRARCDSCGREVTITPPPPDATHDPWWGTSANRFAPHETAGTPVPGRGERFPQD